MAYTLQEALLLLQHDLSLDGGWTAPAHSPGQSGHLAGLLMSWRTLQAKPAEHQQAPVDWPAVLQDQWLGWQRFYAGDYVNAAGAFVSALQGGREVDELLFMGTALGLGKVYTRTGHWAAAREWLLYYLSLSRRSKHDLSVVKGYGALGELFLRSGHPHAALAAFRSAFQLTPAGRGNPSMQLNFLASGFMRNGAFLRAETLLMQSLHTAAIHFDPALATGLTRDSIQHALMRLQFIKWLTRRTQDYLLPPICQDVLREFMAGAGTGVAGGFYAVGKAFLAVAQGQTVEAASQLDLAAQCFGPAYPVEHCWAARLRVSLADGEGSRIQAAPAVAAAISLLPLPAPAHALILDATWSQLQLPTGSAFAPLLEPRTIWASEQALWSRFFI